MSNIDQDALPHALSRPAASPRSPVLLLTAAIAVIGANSLALAPIAPAVAASLQAEVPLVMAAAAAYGLGTAAGALLLARQIDRIGARRALAAALAVLALALAASAAVPSAILLAGTQALAGLAAGVAIPAAYACAAQAAAPGRESATIGVVLTGWTLSMVAGVSLSAVVADLFDWRAVYGGLALLALLAAGLLSQVGGGGQAGHGRAAAPSPLEALAVPGVPRLLAVCGAFMMSFYGVYGYLGAHLAAPPELGGLGRSVAAGGLVTLVYGIGFGGAALLDRVIDRLGAARLAAPAYLAVAAVQLGLSLGSGSFAALVLLAGLWGLFNHFGLNILVLRLTANDPARRGTILGLNSAVTYLAVFAGTLGFAPLYRLGGFAVLPLAGAGLCLLSAALAARR